MFSGLPYSIQIVLHLSQSAVPTTDGVTRPESSKARGLWKGYLMSWQLCSILYNPDGGFSSTAEVLRPLYIFLHSIPFF